MDSKQLPKLCHTGRASPIWCGEWWLPWFCAREIGHDPLLLEKQHAHFSAAGGTQSESERCYGTGGETSVRLSMLNVQL